jgi:ribonuclease-3
MSPQLEELESHLGHHFAERALLLRALTHKSLPAESEGGASVSRDNEQLEFLGDSVLGFLASEHVLKLDPGATEGELSRMKAHLVSAVHLHQAALALGLGAHLRLGRGEELSGGREKKALLANAVEALIAAIYLDAGPERGLVACRGFMERYLWDSGAEVTVPLDPKSALQELAQARKLPMPRYAIIAESGPEHAKVFTVEARVGKAHSAAADGTSKKTASQCAAQLLLDILRQDETQPAT